MGRLAPDVLVQDATNKDEVEISGTDATARIVTEPPVNELRNGGDQT